LFCVEAEDGEEDCPLPASELLACCATAGRASHPLNANTATEQSASERMCERIVAAAFAAAICIATRFITF
jgi:hypothetical protein